MFKLDQKVTWFPKNEQERRHPNGCMTKRIHAVFENTQLCVKIITKLIILRFNHELVSLMMNKGQIYKDLSNFLCVLQN